MMLLIFLLILWIAVIPAVVLGLGTFAAWRRELPPRSPRRAAVPRSGVGTLAR